MNLLIISYIEKLKIWTEAGRKKKAENESMNQNKKKKCREERFRFSKFNNKLSEWVISSFITMGLCNKLCQLEILNPISVIFLTASDSY